MRIIINYISRIGKVFQRVCIWCCSNKLKLSIASAIFSIIFLCFAAFFIGTRKIHPSKKFLWKKFGGSSSNNNKSTSIDFEKMWKVNKQCSYRMNIEQWRGRDTETEQREHAISKSNKTVYYIHSLFHINKFWTFNRVTKFTLFPKCAYFPAIYFRL